MKRVLFCLMFLSTFALAQDGQFAHRTHYRVDTCLAGAQGGVTGWKPCVMPAFKYDYRLTMVVTTHTADFRVALTGADTTARKGLMIPFVSGVNLPFTVPRVLMYNDTLWIKGATNDIIYFDKF